MRGTGLPGSGGRALIALAVALLAGMLAPSLLTASADRPSDADNPRERAPGTAPGAIADAVDGAEALLAPTIDAASRILDTMLAPPGQAPDRSPAEGADTGGESPPKPERSRRNARQRGSEAGPRAAASGAVEIRNFAYSPREITVRAGETVRWTNFDQELHDAAAADGSFRTRLLERGESDSVTFREPGSFQYLCSVHPPSEPQWSDFTGTVTVLAAGDRTGDRGGQRQRGEATPGGSPDGGAGPGGDPGTDAGVGAGGASAGGATQGADDRPRGRGGLPATGLTLLPLIVAGLALLSAGALLRGRGPRG